MMLRQLAIHVEKGKKLHPSVTQHMDRNSGQATGLKVKKQCLKTFQRVSKTYL